MGTVKYTYPIAYVRQSADGAIEVIGIWSIVLAEMCSEVDGSKRITFPCALPEKNQRKGLERNLQHGNASRLRPWRHIAVPYPLPLIQIRKLTYQMLHCHCASKQPQSNCCMMRI